MSAIGYPKVLKQYVDEMLTTYTLYNAEGTERTQFNDYLSLAPAPAPAPEPSTEVYSFPPVGMTSNNLSITGQAHGNGEYLASSSTFASPFDAYYAFDNEITKSGFTTAVGWHSDVFTTDTTTRSYLGDKSLGGVSGEWLKLKLPENILLRNYVLYPRYYRTSNLETNSPTEFKLLGSNDNIEWSVVDSQAELVWTATENTQGEKIFELPDNTKGFNHYAIVVQKTGNPGVSRSSNSIQVLELVFNGSTYTV